MSAEGEQAQPKQRASRDLRNTTGKQGYPDAIDLTAARLAERAKSMPHTDATQIDEGYDQQRPSNNNVMRSRSTTSNQRVTQAQPVPPRHTLTRDLPHPVRSTRTVNLPQEPVAKPQKANKIHGLRNMHWLVLVGVGMAVALFLWVAGSAALSWSNGIYNDIHYGNPRTSQTDAIVGHSDSTVHPSHFIAMNWNHQAVVIEFKAGDPAKSISYVAPVYIGGDDGKAPVTLEFRDVTGDKKLDMIIHIHVPGQDLISVFINNGDSFRASTTSDRIRLQ